MFWFENRYMDFSKFLRNLSLYCWEQQKKLFYLCSANFLSEGSSCCLMIDTWDAFRMHLMLWRQHQIDAPHVRKSFTSQYCCTPIDHQAVIQLSATWTVSKSTGIGSNLQISKIGRRLTNSNLLYLDTNEIVFQV